MCWAVGVLGHTADMDTPADVVRELWARTDVQDWAGLGRLLAPDVVYEWPGTGELIQGREAVVAVNAEYPGRWRIRVVRLVASGDEVTSEVEVTDGDATFWCASFFTVRDDVVVYARELWIDAPTGPRPAARARWTQPLEH